MIKGMRLTREVIIKTLVYYLEPLSYVYSFWEGGAAAFNRIDDWSDIDLYLVVDDSKVDESFSAVEESLTSLSPIKQKYVVRHPPQTGLFQAFYRLRDADDYLILDLAVLTLRSPDKFLEPELHGNVVFYFNKSEKVKPTQLGKRKFEEKLDETLKKLQARFDMFNNFVQKELNRENYLEAIDLYHALTLNSLVKALRIRHNPLHHDFKMRYIHYELPAQIIRRLKHLSFVSDEEDLQRKYGEAINWFNFTMSKIHKKAKGLTFKLKGDR
jgi:hypothetical protein